VFIALLFVLKSMVLFFGSYIQFKISYDYERNTRAELFQKALMSSWSYLLEQKLGHLEKVLSVEIQMVARLLKTLSSIVLILTGLFVYVFVAVNISPMITLVTLGVGLMTLLVSQPLVKKVRELSRQLSSKSRAIAHFVNENIIGMKTVKAASVSAPIRILGETYFDSLRQLELKRSLLGALFGSFFQPLSIIFILLLFSFSYKTSTFNLPAFIAIIYLIQRIFSYVQNLQTHLQSVFSSLPYLEHVLLCQDQALQNEEKDSGTRPFVFEKAFSFRDVSFGYKEKRVLSGVSFSIPKGSFIGLIGPSGAGKTTVVDLALRLFKPDSGEILLDGISVLDIDLHTYRKNVGYVSQDIHLINDTVANNIRFFDESITEEAIVRAAKQAYIYDVIEALPEKFSSVVGERGIHFSAGQRQRIVIARVLARNPQFLILDEATSALDNESEKRIQEVIENLKGKITVLAIAHRLGTVMSCDAVFVLEDGKIVESGNPRELLKNQDSYFFKAHHIRN
ncbi:MAG: ABC transporter ATP-binding protein, partial [Patescibacteria group bacterium]